MDFELVEINSIEEIDYDGEVYDLEVEDFRSTLSKRENHDQKPKALAEICWESTEKVFWVRDIKSRRGAALCFAAQGLSKWKATKLDQEKAAAFIAEVLRNFGGD